MRRSASTPFGRKSMTWQFRPNVVPDYFFSTKCRTRRNVASTKSRMRPIVVSAKWFSTNCRAPNKFNVGLFIDSWLLRVSSKVSVKLHLLCKIPGVFMIPYSRSLAKLTRSTSGFTYFARDLEYSRFHEHSKNRIYFFILWHSYWCHFKSCSHLAGLVVKLYNKKWLKYCVMILLVAKRLAIIMVTREADNDKCF